MKIFSTTVQVKAIGTTWHLVQRPAAAAGAGQHTMGAQPAQANAAQRRSNNK
jgi:hypothetical protein